MSGAHSEEGDMIEMSLVNEDRVNLLISSKTPKIEDYEILKQRACFEFKYLSIRSMFRINEFEFAAGEEDEDWMQQSLFYLSGLMLYGSWWMMGCITGYSLDNYGNIHNMWRGAVSYYFWIPGIACTLAFYIMFRSKQRNTSLGEVETRDVRTPASFSLILIFVSVLSAMWIKLAKFDFTPHVYPCFNATESIIPHFNCTLYYDDDLQIDLPLPRYDGGGWGVVLQTLLIALATIINRHARVMMK